MARKTTSQFITEAKKVHGEKYNYDKVKYINNSTKVCIICKEHGEFYQNPKSHLQGHECAKCAIVKVGNALRLTKDEFISKARQIHGNKYDYSKVNYISNRDKVKIKCPIHGDFFQAPREHLVGKGCSKCFKVDTIYIQHDEYYEIFVKSSKEPIFIDVNDYKKVTTHNWFVGKQGYVESRVKKHEENDYDATSIKLHRFLKNPKKHEYIDHINGNRLDNRKSNLRICTQQQNNMNRKIMKNNTSGVTGVHWDKRINKWVSRIWYKNKEIFLGNYNNIEDATRARMKAEIKYFGKYSRNYYNYINELNSSST